MTELNVKVGDRVAYIAGGFHSAKTIETVSKITPTGRIKLERFKDIQFNKYGRAMGDGYRGRITELTPELEKEIMEKQTIKKCFEKLRCLKSLDYTTAAKILDAIEEMEVLKNE